jgi:uncharacterized ferritin-like protein (DUF455 family)
VTELEAQVVTFKREKTEAQENLQRQQQTDAALKSQIARQTSSIAGQPSQSDPMDPRDERPRHDLISSYGVRAGYQALQHLLAAAVLSRLN